MVGAEFTVPAAYLEENAELAYAGNVYVAQGRTVDTAHLVVSEGMTRDLLYVGMTRGREKNLAHVVTGPPDPADLSREERQACTRAADHAGGRAGRDTASRRPRWPSPLSRPSPRGCGSGRRGNRSSPPRWSATSRLGTAIEAIRAAQDFPSTPGTCTRSREAVLVARTSSRRSTTWSAQRIGWARLPALPRPTRSGPRSSRSCGRHEIGGRPIADVLDSITATPLDGARSIAAVLHGRAGKEPAPARGETTHLG